MIIDPKYKDLDEKELSVREIIEVSLKNSGCDPDSFDILSDEPFVVQSITDSNKVMAFYVAVAKSTGMMFFFAAEPEKVSEVITDYNWTHGPLPGAIGDSGDSE